MTNCRFLFIGVLLLLIMGCAAKGGSQEKAVAAVAPEESYSLAVGDSVQLKDGDTQLWVRIEDIQDNRCPKDVNCITGGSATALLLVEHQPELIALCTGADCREVRNTLEFKHNTQKYIVVLEEVVPYPEVGGTPTPKQIIFKIKRATG